MFAQKIVHIPTQKGRAVDITREIEDFVKKTRVSFGIVNVFVSHTTCSIIIQEKDRMLEADIERMLRELTHQNVYFHPENADSHMKASLLGQSVTIPITRGELGLGTWQSVLLWDFDRTSTRKVVITVIGEVLEEYEEKEVEKRMEEDVLKEN